MRRILRTSVKNCAWSTSCEESSRATTHTIDRYTWHGLTSKVVNCAVRRANAHVTNHREKPAGKLRSVREGMCSKK